jgi:hypothetical protein
VLYLRILIESLEEVPKKVLITKYRV